MSEATKEQIAEFTEFLKTGQNRIKALTAEAATLRKRVEVLEAALRHYADKDNWGCTNGDCNDDSCAHFQDYYLPEKGPDYGYVIAQQALAESSAIGDGNE